MTTTELLAKFADPDIIQTLSLSDKLFAGLVATILGMGITFSALIILQFVIVLMEKILRAPERRSEVLQQPENLQATQKEVSSTETDDELIAVVSSVIALQLRTSVNNIVIRNIEKTDNSSPAWNTAGIVEQMDSRF